MRPQLRSEESRTPKFFKRFKDPVDAGVRIDEDAVRSAYRRWAPVYDHTFGRVAAEGRKHSVEIINQGKGRVLEVGVGTGLSLPAYRRQLEGAMCRWGERYCEYGSCSERLRPLRASVAIVEP